MQQKQLCSFDQNENLEMSLDYGLLIQRDCFPDQKRPIAVQVILVILVNWL